MKTITKLLTINDGDTNIMKNGDFMLVQNYPRTEKIISAFLTDGWQLHSRNFRVTPGDGEGFPFYLGGWDLLFTKEVDDNETDNGDELLSSVLDMESTTADPDEEDLEFYFEDDDEEDEEDDEGSLE